MIRRIIITISFFVGLLANAQTDTIAVDSGLYYWGTNVKSFTDYQLVYVGLRNYHNEYITVDNNSHQTNKYDLRNNHETLYYPSKNPVYIKKISGNNMPIAYQLKSINQFGYGIQLMDLFIDSSKVKPPYGEKTINEKFYVSGFKNQKFCLFETDGSVAGSQIVFQHNDSIIAVFSLNDSIVIVTEINKTWSFYKEKSGTVNFLGTITKPNYTIDFNQIGEDVNDVFFNYAENNVEKVLRLNMANGIELSNYLKYGEVKKIIFRGNSVGIKYSQSDDQRQVWFYGSKNNPNHLDTISYSGYQGVSDLTVMFDVAHDYFLTYTNKYGFEFAKLTETNGFEVIDFLEGSNSAFPVSTKGVKDSHPAVFEMSELGDVLNNGQLVTILSNGNDNHYYAYEISVNGSRCLFQVENSDDIFVIIKTNKGYIIISKGDRTLVIMENAKQAIIQPLDKSLEVIKSIQLATNLPGAFYIYANSKKNQVNHIVQDDSKNTYVGMYPMFFNNYFQGQASLASSDGQLPIPINSQYLISKLGENGKLLWATSIGSTKYADEADNTVFDATNSGNIIASGRIRMDAQFDSIVINDVHRKTYITKLNSETGKVDWVRFITSNYEEQNLSIYKVKILPNGDFYLLFNYKGVLNIDHRRIGINSLWYQSNLGIAKYSQDGTMYWVKHLTEQVDDEILSFSGFDISPSGNSFVIGLKRSFRVNDDCENYNESIDVTYFDSDGNWIKKMTVTSSQLVGIKGLKYDSENEVSLIGEFTGRINIKKASIESERVVDGCFTSQLYHFKWNLNSNKVTDLRYIKSNLGVIKNVSFYDNEVSVLLENENSDLTGLYFNNDFNDVKELNLYQKSAYNNLNYFLTVEDSNILFTGTNLNQNLELGYQPMMNTTPSNSILYIPKNKLVESNVSWTYVSNKSIETADYLWVYPNPASNYLNISVFDAYPYTECVLVDLNGREIKRIPVSDASSIQVNVSDIANGLYFIKLESAKKVLIKKVMILSNEI